MWSTGPSDVTDSLVGDRALEQGAPSAPVCSLSGMDERVLLVEDDPSIKDVVLHGLQQAGFKVVGESDGRPALLRFNQESFDVVVLDIMLPSLSGLEVCREIRRDSNVSLIMLTAKTDTMDIVIGL